MYLDDCGIFHSEISYSQIWYPNWSLTGTQMGSGGVMDQCAVSNAFPRQFLNLASGAASLVRYPFKGALAQGWQLQAAPWMGSVSRVKVDVHLTGECSSDRVSLYRIGKPASSGKAIG